MRACQSRAGHLDTSSRGGRVKEIQSMEFAGQLANNNLDYRIQTWALEEARRRLEAEGILEDPQNKK